MLVGHKVSVILALARIILDRSRLKLECCEGMKEDLRQHLLTRGRAGGGEQRGQTGVGEEGDDQLGHDVVVMTQ